MVRVRDFVWHWTDIAYQTVFEGVALGEVLVVYIGGRKLEVIMLSEDGNVEM